MKKIEATREVVILCEGFHDRAFWVGWLAQLGVNTLGKGQIDPSGALVQAPQFPLKRDQTFVRLVSCEGDQGVLNSLGTYLEKAKSATPLLAGILVNLDDDGTSDAPLNRAKLDQIAERIRRSGYPTEREHDRLFIPTATLRVAVVLWRTPVEHSPHDERPDKQTLERLVCTSICEAYPDRTPAVRAWLDSRPDPPEGLDHKAHAWSHMAGWFAENGCDDFFKALWRDDRVRVVLERRLRAEGAWDLVTALV